MDLNVLLPVGAFALILIVGSAVLIHRRLEFSKLPPDVQTGIRRARDARDGYRQTLASHKKRVRTAQKNVDALEDPKGRLLHSSGGVEIYERWLDTPQGGGSLIGATARVENDTNLVGAQGLNTNPSGPSAFTVIEGPNVSGIAEFPFTEDGSPMKRALDFSAKVNNAARSAEQSAPGLPAKIAAARRQLDVAQNEDSTVDEARKAYLAAVILLPVQYRKEFADVEAE